MIPLLVRVPHSLLRFPAESEDFAKGPPWFPAVGWVIGGIILHATSAESAGNPLDDGGAAGGSGSAAYGSLHLDGLADSFDGLYSNRDRERILEIMKDSRIGSNGVVVTIGAAGAWWLFWPPYPQGHCLWHCFVRLRWPDQYDHGQPLVQACPSSRDGTVLSVR